MRTKTFVVKTTASVYYGRLLLKCIARYRPEGSVDIDEARVSSGGWGGETGSPAFIFQLGTVGASPESLLRARNRYDQTPDTSDCQEILFDTGAELLEFLTKLQEDLNRREAHHEHLLAECAALRSSGISSN